MEIFGRFRMADSNISKWNEGGADTLRARLEPFVNNSRQIKFLMLGYPFKSTNHVHKTLGTLPDLAERVSLEQIARFGQEVAAAYSPGVRLTVLSDGFMFNDIAGENESVVETYHDATLDIASDTHAPIELLTLRDLYPGVELSQARDKIASQFGINEFELERRILTDANVNWLYRAMIRFMEEETANRPQVSKRQHHLSAKALARSMMQRNEVYSNFAEQQMPEYIRLSMHPTTNERKWGFRLIPGENARHSPWHCALLLGPGDSYTTIHRADAEAAGYRLVMRNSQPSHYESL
jgi:pyoverdine/dityrosine biosynthesis protein Dit1